MPDILPPEITAEELQRRALGMPAPVVAPPSGGASTLAPPIQSARPVSATGVPMYNSGEEVPATGTAPPTNPHVAEIQRMEQTGSGVQQVQQKHPFWGGVLRGLDTAASIISPRIAANIPGTTMHHNQLIGQEEVLANQDTRRAQEEAQTNEINQRPQMQQAEFEHQGQIEAQREAARQSQQEQAQREAQQHLDQQTQAQEDRSEQQQGRSEEQAKAAEECQGRQFAEQEKLAGMREAGMEKRASATAARKENTQSTEQLTPAAQGILQTTSPVKDQVDQLIGELTPYQNGGRLTLDRLGYALGEDSPEGSLASDISKLSLDRVIAGARVLKGSS